MSNFKIVRKGYSQIEVDEYISKLINSYETKLAEQKDRIFYLKDQLDKITNSSDSQLVSSLVSAVERAKLIENSSKNIYELETKKLGLLYTKMENLLKDENIHNDRSIKQELIKLIEDCRVSLQNSISQQDKNIKENALTDPVKKLLSKMIDFNKIPTTQMNKTEDVFEGQSIKYLEKQNKKVVQTKRAEPNTKPIDFQKFLSKNDNFNGSNYENVLLSNKEEKKQNYITNDMAPNETGFDLKEAVNPKEDLDEIMKAFDFYNDKKGKN